MSKIITIAMGITPAGGLVMSFARRRPESRHYYFSPSEKKTTGGKIDRFIWE